MSKIKLKKSNLKSLYVLVSMEIGNIEKQQEIWEADKKMNAERKAKRVKECKKKH